MTLWLTLEVKSKIICHSVAYNSKSEPLHCVLLVFKVLWDGPTIGVVTYDIEVKVKVIQRMLINICTNCVPGIRVIIFSL